MTIDLRYVIAAASFYVPGLMMLSFCWMLGYETAQVREPLAVMGGFFGFVAAALVAGFLFIECKPILVRIGK